MFAIAERARATHGRFSVLRLLRTVMRLEPVICLPNAWSSAFGRFVVHLFEGHLSIADMERIRAEGDRWSVAHPGARVELVVIFPSDATMTSEERSRMARLIKDGEGRRAASATVILATGLRASVQRSILTGLLMVVPPPHPSKVFGQLDSALHWLVPHAQSACDPRLGPDPLTQLVGANIVAFRARAAQAKTAGPTTSG